jgi:hypothetical protein
MKVTAFHLVGKVEEAARSYFSNSFVFSSRKVDVERTVDFRKGSASLAFFVKDGPERVPMGGIEINTIQERDRKVAFQCRSTILPSGDTERFFLILPEDVEQYSQYTHIASMLSDKWDKGIDAYLPKHEEMPQEKQEAPKSLDDEYASLSPEEIEAITGVKPAPKGAASAAAAPAPVTAAPANDIPAPDAASEEEIQKLMGMMMSGEAQPAAPGPTGGDAGQIMSMEEIEALAKQVRETPEGGASGAAPAANAGTVPAPAPAAAPAPAVEQPAAPVAAPAVPVAPAAEKPAEKPSDEMSAEDIWKQINSGK